MACTTVLVGRNASNDHSTMIARTDDGHFDIKKIIVTEPKNQPRVYESKIAHLKVELPDNPMRYTSCPNVDGTSGIWPATGINAAQVGMTATETITSNPRVLAADPMVVYQKAKSRREKWYPRRLPLRMRHRRISSKSRSSAVSLPAHRSWRNRTSKTASPSLPAL